VIAAACVFSARRPAAPQGGAEIPAVPPPLPRDTAERDARLRALATGYRAPLVRYFLRRGMAMEAAEDCAHEVFVRLSRVDPAAVDNAEAYLFTIASSVLVDRSRAARTRQEQRHGPLDEAMEGRDASPVQALEGREALRRLSAILDELPPRTREIFLLNRLEGLSYTQLAARYAMSVKSIEKRMSKALAHLRRRYESE
jgi:RNA polymerase sigma-70 factor (ECF subfamily)